MQVSIIIPAYNEQRCIQETLDIICCYLEANNVDAEIIIVDDGSKDNTFLIAEEFSKKHNFIVVLRNDCNRGKGFSVRKGVLAARGDCVLFLDADNSTPIEEIKKVMPLILNNEYDVVLGSRSIEGSDVRICQPYFRIVMGRIFNLFVKMLFYREFKDTQCGFKCFSRKAAKEVFSKQRINKFAFDVEILAIAKQRGFRIKEVPVCWINNPCSKVHPIKDAFVMFVDLFRIKVNLMNKKYN
ncbi:MAG: glycosyltransferase family 2 protein [Candidatus Omnitrophica bacterium]|nr:glycosyltransferase family 2 protein [Candidatus Omnitrophota bacterium]